MAETTIDEKHSCYERAYIVAAHARHRCKPAIIAWRDAKGRLHADPYGSGTTLCGAYPQRGWEQVGNLAGLDAQSTWCAFCFRRVRDY